MFLNAIYFRHLEILHRSSFFSGSVFIQLLGNLFLTAKTMFNWNFQSVAISTVQSFVAKYLRKECDDINEVAADNDDDKDDNDDANSKDFKVVEIGTSETLTMLYRLVDLK